MKTVFDELNEKLQEAGIRSFRVFPGESPDAEKMARQIIDCIDDLISKPNIIEMMDTISEPLKDEANTEVLTHTEIDEISNHVFPNHHIIFDYDNQLYPRVESSWEAHTLNCSGYTVAYVLVAVTCIIKRKYYQTETVKWPDDWKWKPDAMINHLTKDDE